MSADLFLSRFTPSMMSPEVLEKVFVQRGDLANRMVEVARESILTPAKHHTLVVGPRGTGKTHLLSLVHNRIAAMDDLADRVRIAWLREEEWGVASFLDFLYRILRALAARYEDEGLGEATERLFSMPLKTAERRAADLLRELTEGKTLLLIAENLDSVFSGLGKKGQQRLRAHLQEEEAWTIVGSSQALFGGVSLYDSPFYGFFDIHHLEELTVEDAARLVQNVAELNQNAELADYVQSEEGRARIRAVHHLAGGNHRVYMILSEFLTRESLDQLVDPFLRMMDDLTPYYQARMEQLSPQQRKIIDLLCNVHGAVPVKEIARRCFITSQTASSQLKDLRDRGFVESTPVGRDAFYELAEPLMRLALEVKGQRDGFVRLFVDFLRHWYAREELVGLLDLAPLEATLERMYLQSALSTEVTRDPPRPVHALDAQAASLEAEGRWRKLLRVAKELVRERGGVADWTTLANAHYGVGQYAEALDALDRAFDIDSAYPPALYGRMIVLAALARWEDLLTFVKSAAEQPQGSVLHLAHLALLRTIIQQERTSRAFIGTGMAAPTNSAPTTIGLEIQHRQQAVRATMEYSEVLLRLNPGDWISTARDNVEAVIIPLQCLLVSRRFTDAELALGSIATRPEVEREEIVYEVVADLLVADEGMQAALVPFVYRGFTASGLGRALRIALMATGSLFISHSLSDADRNRWLAMWKDTAGKDAAFKWSVGFLASLAKHRETGDPRALLVLPAEVREIAERLIADTTAIGYLPPVVEQNPKSWRLRDGNPAGFLAPMPPST